MVTLLLEYITPFQVEFRPIMLGLTEILIVDDLPVPLPKTEI